MTPPKRLRQRWFFRAKSPAEARGWQQAARDRLFQPDDGRQQTEPMRTQAEDREDSGHARSGISLGGDLTANTAGSTRARLGGAAGCAKGEGWRGAGLHGHGGTGEQIVRGQSLYWYGKAMLEKGWLVVAPDIGQHELQHTNWSLMGERTWDALRALDYALTLPEADPERVAVAGLSLGGETTMYVAALDERLKLACSSGWLTTVANMKNGHCKCFNFPGLEESFDFSDIFACVAPRELVCELAKRNVLQAGFPSQLAAGLWSESRLLTGVRCRSNVQLTVHPAGHVFSGKDFLPRLEVLQSREKAK